MIKKKKKKENNVIEGYGSFLDVYVEKSKLPSYLDFFFISFFHFIFFFSSASTSLYIHGSSSFVSILRQFYI